MRYFLAVQATLACANAPASTRLEQCLQTWFDASARYPRQLRELERDDYLQMKRDEYRRQQDVNENAPALRIEPPRQ